MSDFIKGEYRAITNGDSVVISNGIIIAQMLLTESAVKTKATAHLMATSKELLKLSTDLWSAIENGKVDEKFFELRAEFRRVTDKAYGRK